MPSESKKVMLKISGLLMIIAVGGILGFRASEFLRLRNNKLTKYCLFIGEIADLMRLGRDLEHIYKTPRAKELLIVSGYFVKVKEDGLLTEDKALLTEFFSKLGMGDLSSGLALCESYLKIISTKKEEAEKQVIEKARLYSLLGIFSGIFVAIILV